MWLPDYHPPCRSHPVKPNWTRPKRPMLHHHHLRQSLILMLMARMCVIPLLQHHSVQLGCDDPLRGTQIMRCVEVVILSPVLNSNFDLQYCCGSLASLGRPLRDILQRFLGMCEYVTAHCLCTSESEGEYSCRKPLPSAHFSFKFSSPLVNFQLGGMCEYVTEH